MDILIMGGGMCGLGAAMLLARDGHDVTVLERDADPVPDSPHDAWENWTRKGVAQFRQPHNLMPGLRLLLEADLPDVQEALRRRGGQVRPAQPATSSVWRPVAAADRRQALDLYGPPSCRRVGVCQLRPT